MSGSRNETEEKFKEAAIRIWSRHGFHGASVKMIAEEAGANVSLINRYFGGKEGLLLAIVHGMIEEKQTGDLDYPPQLTLEKEILAYLQFRYKQDIIRQDVIRIVISEMTINKDFRHKALTSMTYGADANFRERLSQLQKNGQIAPKADLRDLFRQISLFSFSCSFIEGLILELPEHDTSHVMARFAKAIAADNV